MPKRSPHPHVAWRDGRPRFSPDQILRAAGHKGQDLRHADGSWYSRGEAVDWSDRFVASLTAAKAPQAPALPARRTKRLPPAVAAQPALPARPSARLVTVGAILNEWQTSKKFRPIADPHELAAARAAHEVYSPKSQKFYRYMAGMLERDEQTLWHCPVDALSQAHMVNLYEKLAETKGEATAKGALRTLGSALTWGKRRGRYAFAGNQGVSPTSRLGMAATRTRLRIGSRAEISALIAAADRLGLPHIGDMVTLGLWTGQRQEDRLALIDRGLVRGRRVFRQGKTGALVAIREAPELETRLAASAERRRRAGVVDPHVVIDEERWAPWPEDGNRLRLAFNAVKAEAARFCPSLAGIAAEGIKPFQESDLRATAVTWMAMAGATIPEIIAVTGHTLASATNILRHYLATNPGMADSAIGKLVAWYEGDEEAEFGI